MRPRAATGVRIVMRWLVLAAIVVLAPDPADACSVTRTFLPPSNFELVARAPRIVIAKAVRSEDAGITLEVTRVLKGPAKRGESITVRGHTRRYRGASAKTDWSRARQGAYAGSCIALDYQLGRHYLLLLDDGNALAGAPFTRINEEVDPANDPWTTGVATYIELAALPAAEREPRITALIARTGDATAKAIAEDLARHRATPSAYKSFAELDAMYRAAAPDARGPIVIAIGTGGDQAAKPFMKLLVQAMRDGAADVDARFALIAIGAYYQKVHDPAVLAQVAELYTALGPQQKQARWDLMWLLIRRADASLHAVMERALAGADDEEAARLAEYFARAPSEPARKDLARRVGTAYAAKWELALGLASLGDKPALAWAQQGLAAKTDDRWIALYMIAMSPLPAADALAGKLIAKGGQDVETLIQGYGKARHAHAEARLAALAKDPALPAETRRWLDRTIAERAHDGP